MRRRRSGARCFGLLALVGLALFCVGCERRSDRVPVELIGRWTTAESEYEGRFMEILATSVRFGAGEGEASSHPVLEVTTRKLAFDIEHTIVYGVPGQAGEYRLHLLYDPSIHILRLENRPRVIWELPGRAELEPLLPANRLAASRNAG